MTLVIGVGNPWRGDDGAGPAVAQALGGAHVDDPLRLLEEWEHVEHAIVVDAAASGAPPGTVRRFDARSGPLPPAALRCSTHAFGVPDAIELARALGRLPARLEVYAIEGAEFGHGAELTPAVALAVAELARTLEASARAASTSGRNAPEQY
jgi:hydrogenase maturation protease